MVNAGDHIENTQDGCSEHTMDWEHTMEWHIDDDGQCRDRRSDPECSPTNRSAPHRLPSAPVVTGKPREPARRVNGKSIHHPVIDSTDARRTGFRYLCGALQAASSRAV